MFDIRYKDDLKSFFRLDTVFGGVGSMMRMVDKVELDSIMMLITSEENRIALHREKS